MFGALFAMLGFTGPARAADAPAAPVKHVFIVVLENESYRVTFGPKSPAPYLARTLPSKGALIRNYYGVVHLSHGNYVAMVSGQGANLQEQTDCQFFTDFEYGLLNGHAHYDPSGTPLTGRDGQSLGTGCVFPTSVPNITDQLNDAGLTWKGYMDDMATPCLHPTIGTRDDTQHAQDVPGGLYAARHNPFVYFHSIIDSPACQSNVIGLDQLETDVRSALTTPNYSFIVPDLCNDGHDEPCVNGQPGGLVQANSFLQKLVPMITKSAAYRRDGLLLVVFDEAEPPDARACCGQQLFPNTFNNGFLWPGRGGGHTGAVALSPFIKPGTVSLRAYNHFSQLKSIEQFFGLGYIGYAGQRRLRAFGTDIFTQVPTRASR
jgi:hypothetical protein